MATIFTKIINGEIPCHKIAETIDCLAFLDINPIREGHVLVIPKKEVDYIFDLDASLLSKLMLFAQKVAKAIEITIPCKRIGIAVIGLEVPHTHIHLVPINSVSDINFASPKLQPSADRLAEIASRIRQNFMD
jgi:histidine triad (HIT) family protein